jgi:hypothetical protein
MQIKIVGGTKAQKNYVKSMVKFCAKKLMPRMHNLDITVKLTGLKGEAYGYCLSNEDETTDRPRTFELEIERGLQLRRLLETVAHEMVHVKQYARGELYQGVRIAKHRWQGKWVSNSIDYWEQPWEIEAHGREAGLFIRWAEANDLGSKSWTHDK